MSDDEHEPETAQEAFARVEGELALLRRAVALDPGFAAAQGALAELHTARAVSMATTRSWSAGRSCACGQSARCTDRSPVSPRQTSSVVSGRRGAATRQSTSSAV